MSVEVARLLQAVDQFRSRTENTELPQGTEEALKGLSEALGQPVPDRDTPGGRAAAAASPGTQGTGEHFSKAAKGPDKPSPGQRAAKESLSEEIHKAAASIVAAQK